MVEFIAEHGAITMRSHEAGARDVRLETNHAADLAALFRREGEGDLAAALDLALADLALAPLRIAVLEPITVEVRQLDPAIWGDLTEPAE
jgi:hypothetical protein